MSERKYYLGCPVWQSDAWRGSLLPSKAARADSLRYYSQVFSTVEGNATFYAIPELSVMRRWAEQAEEGFRFALKFPRVITHECQLVGADQELGQFLECLAVLAESQRLGPSFLQLPPGFSSRQFAALDRFLARLPKQWPFAVEARHEDYFSGPAAEEFDDRLRSQSIDRVIFDSRPLFSRPPSDPMEVESQRRKPRSPIRPVVTGRQPFLRLVGRNDLELVEPWIGEWTNQIAQWIGQGLQPYVFTHAPDDAFAPEFARRFHESLRRQVADLAPLAIGAGAREPKQQSLFD